MKKFIPVEALVEKEKYEFITAFDNTEMLTTKVKIREVECFYHTCSKRTLWQAVGIEHIEPEMLDYIDTIPSDSVFFDIGASNGIFSIYAMQKKLKVFSFEPEIQNFALLGKNCYLNSKSVKHQAQLFNVAISNSNEMGNMYIARFEAGGHMKILDKAKKVQENETFEPDFVQNILKFSLDSIIGQYGLPLPEYVKIDVDGAEEAVINGAVSTLSNNVLKSVFIELEEDKKETARIIDKLNEYGFVQTKKIQVQNYVGLYNYIFERNKYE